MTNRISHTKQKAPAATFPPPPAPTLPRFATAADRLDDAAVLLHGLHRRHKNQHRVSTFWWPAFGQLRRNVDRLRKELRGVGDDAEAASHVESHASTVRAELIPKTYLALSRLVADKQFAPLGLLLMGVLAQVHTALRQVTVSGDRDNSPHDKSKSQSQSESENADTNKIYSSAGDDSEGHNDGAHTAAESASDFDHLGDDFGVAVARELEEDDCGKAASVTLERRKMLVTHTPSTKKRLREDDDDVASVSKLKLHAKAGLDAKSTDKGTPAQVIHAKKRRVENEFEADRLAGADNKDERKEMKKTDKEKDKEKSKKAKKRKRHGDEFDDLFSGLL